MIYWRMMNWLPYSQRFCESNLNRPSNSDSCVNHTTTESSALRPFREAKSFALELNHPIFSSVSALLFLSRPTAVFRAVIPIIINSIKRHFGRAATHISKKVFKRFNPPVANLDSPAAIVFKSWIMRIQASRQHSVVNLINSRVSRFPMSCKSFGSQLIPKAAAGHTESSLEIIAINNGSFSAVAFTNPTCIPFEPSGVCNYRPSKKPSSGQIYKSFVFRNGLCKNFGRGIVNHVHNVFSGLGWLLACLSHAHILRQSAGGIKF